MLTIRDLSGAHADIYIGEKAAYRRRAICAFFGALQPDTCHEEDLQGAKIFVWDVGAELLRLYAFLAETDDTDFYKVEIYDQDGERIYTPRAGVGGPRSHASGTDTTTRGSPAAAKTPGKNTPMKTTKNPA